MVKKGALFWKVKKIVSKGDYNYCLIEGTHPSCKSTKYVLHHRIVMENHLGRVLNSNEVVHHIDENKKNNSINNLQLMLVEDHTRLHSSTGRKWVKLKCPECKNIFDREERQSFLHKGTDYTCCSRQCRGKLSRKIQLQGKTKKMEKAISENLVLKYVKYFSDNPEETI